MLKAPSKVKEIYRREQRTLHRSSPLELGDQIILLSRDVGFSDAQDVTDAERGRLARRRLTPRSHKIGGSKRPIMVPPASSRSPSSASSRRSEIRSPKSPLVEERDKLVISFQDRARAVCASVLQLSSRLDAIILQEKWNHECKALEERLRSLDSARDFVGAIEQFTAHFTKDNIFKPTASSAEIISASILSPAGTSHPCLSASAVVKLLSTLTRDLDAVTLVHVPAAPLVDDSGGLSALPTTGDEAVLENSSDTTDSRPAYTATEVVQPSGAEHTTVTVQTTATTQTPVFVEPPQCPPSENPRDAPPRTYYEELMIAALPITNTRPLNCVPKPSITTDLKDRVLFSRSERRDSPVHLLEGKGCTLGFHAASSSSPNLSSPTTPSMSTGSLNPHFELATPGELVSEGRISTKRRRAVRPPLHVHAESYMYSYSQDQSDATPSPGELQGHGDSDANASPIGVSGDVPATHIEHPIQPSTIRIHTITSASHSGKAAAANYIDIAGEVRFPPQTHRCSLSARQRFATWSISGFAGAAEAGNAGTDALESGYAGDLAQFRQRQHSTGMSLLEKVWRW